MPGRYTKVGPTYHTYHTRTEAPTGVARRRIRAVGDPRTATEIETIASADRLEPTVATGPALSADTPELAQVSPQHYQVEGEFARGGMGRILLALDRRLGRRIALKELHGEAGPGAPRRFVREALVTARLQ